MKTIKLIKTKVKNLAEIFQAVDIKFAFVNKNFEEVSTPAKCRDFLGDCIWSRKKGKPISIYMFSYDYKQTPYDDCRFSLKFPDEHSKTNFINNLPYLHEKEKKAGVKLSRVFSTQEKDTLVIEGSNYWIRSSWKISLYTFYLKVISYENVTQLQSPENGYMAQLTAEREATLLSKVKKVDEVLADDIGTQHNYSGFVSAIKGQSYVAVDNHKLIFGK